MSSQAILRRVLGHCRIQSVLVAFLVVMAPLMSPGAMLAYEPFGPTGGLTTNLLVATPTGTGFSGAWTASTGDAGSATTMLRIKDAGVFTNGWPKNVSFPTPSGGRAQMQDSAWSWKTFTRPLATPIHFTNTTTYYVSYLLHDYGNNNYNFQTFLGNSTSGQRIYFGHGYGGQLVAVRDATSRTWPKTTNDASIASSWPACTSSQSILVLAQFTCDGMSNTTIRVKHYTYDALNQVGDYVNPSPASVPWEASYTNQFSGVFDQLGLSVGGMNSYAEISEVRLGTNWNEIMSVDTSINSTLINVSLGPLPAGQSSYVGAGPVIGSPSDLWNAVALAPTNATTYDPLTSAPLVDSYGVPTSVTVQVGVDAGVAKLWSTTGTNRSGELAALVRDYVVFSGPDALIVHGLDTTKSYDLYCFNGPLDGSTCQVIAGGMSKTMTTYGSWITPWRETQQYVTFTNLAPDPSGNLTINLGLNSAQALCGFQLQAVSARFSAQPQDQVAPPGSTVRLHAAVSDANSLPAFRWQQNIGGGFSDMVDGPGISGTASPTLTLSNISPTNAGDYRVVATIGTVVTNSQTATLTVQSGPITQTLARDTNSILHNPFMGWVLYATDGGKIANADTFWNQVSAPFLPHATTCYLRCVWSSMEPQENVFAWDTDTNFIALIQGAKERGIKLAFRVIVDSQDMPQQATPQWAFDAGVPVISTSSFGSDPDITDPLFQQKYTAFINAFGARFNDPDTVNFVDASTFGQWGENNVGNQTLTTAEREQTMTWLINSYSNAFTRVPLAMNFPGNTWSNTELDNYCFNSGCVCIRRDGLGPYNWVSTSQQSAIQARWPSKPFIGEGGHADPPASEQVVVVAQSLFLHANFLDLRQPYSAWHKLRSAPELIQHFNLYGGYRFNASTVSYPGIIQPNTNLVLQATVQNWGAGVLPNNLRQWNRKYKFAWALLDASGQSAATIVDTAPADDPGNWTNGTPYLPPLASGIPSGLMSGYWNTNNKTFTLTTTNNFGNIPPGNYDIGAALVDTSKSNLVDITLANAAPRSDSGWTVVGPVIVGAPPAVTLQPASQIVSQGATVQFSVAATGFPSPTFQWRRGGNILGDGPTANGSLISGCNSSLLTISNAMPADSGYFSTDITNSIAGTNSQTAQLLVVAPPSPNQEPRLAYAPSGNQFGIRFDTLAGYRYLVQRRTDLGPSGNWVTLTNVPPSFADGVFEFSEGYINAAGFYRACVVQP